MLLARTRVGQRLTLGWCRNSSSSAALQYCVESVRRSDFDHFLATLLLPAKSGARDSVFALRAFNVELAKILDSTQNRLVAQAKFQFWRDAVEKIYAGQSVPNQPVTIALSEAVRRKKLTRKWLSGLIEKRLEMVGRRGFASLTELENYANDTVSHLLYSTLECLSVRDLQADHVASHIGKAIGLVNHVRSIPLHAAAQRVLIPTDLLVLHKVSQEEIIRGHNQKSSGLKNVVFDLAAQAHLHLDHARKASSTVKSEAKVAFIPTAAVDVYLKRLQSADFDVFHPSLSRKVPLLPLNLWWLKVRRQY